MYLVDANILVYATDDDSEHHDAARDWLDEHTAGVAKSVGLPWPTLLAYLRLVTNPRIYSPPATSADAWQRVEDWLTRPAVWIPVPGPQHQHGLGPVLDLALLVLHRHDETGRQVRDTHGRVRGVDRLSAWSGRAVNVDPDLSGLDLHLDLVGLR